MHKRLRLGNSNTSSVYYQSWQGIKPMADSSISNSYITHAAFTYAERKTALNWRFGTLWSNKMAYRYQFSNTSKCPLCGEPDGVSISREDAGMHPWSACIQRDTTIPDGSSSKLSARAAWEMA